MFDDPNKELRRLQEQLLEAEGIKPKKDAPAEPKKAASKPKKETKKSEKPKKKPSEERDIKRLGGLLIALLLELALMLTVVVIWLLWK